MHTTIRLYLPLSAEDLSGLSIGDRICLSGTLYTARDAAHKRLITLIDEGAKLPVDLQNAVIFYAGPTPPPPGKPLGSIGPTTASRMDPYAIPLMARAGVKAMIGKGQRSREFRAACRQYKCVYFAATGGVAALLHKHILNSETVAYADLGPEAIRMLTVKDFPVIVANDIHGRDIFEEAQQEYRASLPGIPE